MTTANSYIPIDRQHALMHNIPLPERMTGTVLFADMSGFTALTEALAQELGTKRGAEELTIHLNHVYDALIDQLHTFGGTVIGFSGDAITCWLDNDVGRQAVACGLAMQAAMAQFSQVQTHAGRVVSLAIKVAIASGTVRRFIVGNPSYRLIDVMAGEPLEQMAAAEKLAERGDVLVHRSTMSALRDDVIIQEWVAEDVARVVGLDGTVPDMAWDQTVAQPLSTEIANQWLLPQVAHRLANQGRDFLAELRPACALFMRFDGIHYNNDPDAPAKLNALIQGIERILIRYDGSLIQLTIGDKGSYLYVAFGAPIAHEDDAIRATAAALEMRHFAATFDYLAPVQIGLTRGRMRTGAYGSRTRRTYGVLGDNVNLAARLMAFADAGAIVTNAALRTATGSTFTWDDLPPMQVKGKQTTITPARLVDWASSQQHIHSRAYAQTMVGRSAEFKTATDLLAKAQNGDGQLLGISGEAGMGKSRFINEIRARATTMDVLVGEASSYGTDSSYLVWQSIWRSFFNIDTAQPLADQVATVTAALRDMNPALLARLPLLAPVLGLPIPHNDLTHSLDARVRKSSLEALLVTCLQTRAATQPLMLILENWQWSDALSQELLWVIGRVITQLPVMIVVLFRPNDNPLPITKLAHYTHVHLTALNSAEAEQLIIRKLTQLVGDGARGGAQLIQTVTDRADGNPFYIEEILNYLTDLQIDLDDEAALAAVDLPTSIYSLILSRIDQLTDDAQMALRVASVAGRIFRASIIAGIYPELGQSEAVIASLDHLLQLDLLALKTLDPELMYLFTYIITQQVAYESLLYATRARLHEAIGRFFEQHEADNLEAHYPLLAFHFEHSENSDKKRHYLIKAGEVAQSEYANAAAINYYSKALPMVAGAERVAILLKLGAVQELVGAWDAASTAYQEAQTAAAEIENEALLAQTYIALGELARKQGNYQSAETAYAQAKELAESADDPAGVAKALICRGTLHAQQGEYDTAHLLYEESLAIRRQLNDILNSANVLNNMGIVARFQGDYGQSQHYHQQALALRRDAQNRWGVAASLNNLGNVTVDLGDLTAARNYLEEAVTFQREIGDQWYLANALNNLGNVVREQQDAATALVLYQESLRINRALDDSWALAYLLDDVGMLFASSDPQRALTLAGAAAAVREEIGSPLSTIEQQKLQTKLAPAQIALGDRAQAVWRAGQQMGVAAAIALVLEVGL